MLDVVDQVAGGQIQEVRMVGDGGVAGVADHQVGHQELGLAVLIQVLRPLRHGLRVGGDLVAEVGKDEVDLVGRQGDGAFKVLSQPQKERLSGLDQLVNWLPLGPAQHVRQAA